MMTARSGLARASLVRYVERPERLRSFIAA
jgi:hypothetical protein